MRKLVLVFLTAVIGLGSYAVWPVVTAFQIKQAVRHGDVATLERKVLWEPVRASLKASIAELAPANSASLANTDAGSPARAGGVAAVGFWDRIKMAAAPMLADGFVDRYVNPEGISQLQYVKRGGWRAFVGLTPKVQAGGANAAVSDALQGSESAAAEDALDPLSRFLAFYERVLSAKFHSLTHVEFEIADKSSPNRRFISQFQLMDYEWKLASVRIVGQMF